MVPVLTFILFKLVRYQLLRLHLHLQSREIAVVCVFVRVPVEALNYSKMTTLQMHPLCMSVVKWTGTYLHLYLLTELPCKLNVPEINTWGATRVAPPSSSGICTDLTMRGVHYRYNVGSYLWRLTATAVRLSLNINYTCLSMLPPKYNQATGLQKNRPYRLKNRYSLIC